MRALSMIKTSFVAGVAALFILATPAASADLGGIEDAPLVEPAEARSPWRFTFTTYGWLPWLSGDLAIKGRRIDVSASPTDIIDALDWSTLPVWMSYAEARNGRFSLFNDIVYTKLEGSNDIVETGPLGRATLSGNLKADYEQATIELGAAYELWSGPMMMRPTAFDILAGGRYWYQSTSVSADVDLNLTLPLLGDRSVGRVVARSGSVDWVDPFIGARLRHELAPGQSLSVRGDVGGFDAGSDFSWQVLATYNFNLCITTGYVLDGYLGYRALSVDYSEGTGSNRYEYDVLQQGPVVGATLRF
jgi:hypothetical protein